MSQIRLYFRVALLAVPLALSTAGSTPAQSARRPIQLDDWYGLKQVDGLAVSPDGRAAVFTVSEIDRVKDRRTSSLWRVAVAGGQPERLTQTGSVSSPRFSPDGRFLAFVSDRYIAGGPVLEKAAEKGQVFLLPLTGGEAYPVTALPEGVDTLRWAPDSKRLVVVSRDAREGPEEAARPEGERDTAAPPIVLTRLQHKRDGSGWLDLRRRHLYVIELDNALEAPGRAVAVTKTLTAGPYDDGDPAWAPEGGSIAFSSNRSKDPDENDNTDIWIVDAQGGDPRRLTTDPGSDDNPVFSPDGQRIAYVHMPEDPPIYATPRVQVVPVSSSAPGGSPRDVTGKLDRHVSGTPRWAGDGKSIYTALVDSGRTPLVQVTLDGARTTVYDGDISDFEIAGDHAVVTASTPTRPSEILAVPLAGGSQAVRALTRVNEDLLSKLDFEPAEEVHFKSADGTPIEGWVIKPPGFEDGSTTPKGRTTTQGRTTKLYPLILRIHGGPVGQYTDSFYFEHQYLASLGYVVLITNPRGSNGYGEAFCRAIFADWGNKDYQDVMAGVDHMLTTGYIDAKKLGVGGWSYGGIMTNYTITKTTRFAAATSGAGAVDMFSNFGTDDLRLWWIRELGLPWRNLDLYRKLSPLMSIEKVTTPTLIMVGDRDYRVPLPQSEQLYVALRSLGKPAALVVYPGQSHGISRPSYQIDRLRRYGLWYDKYILGKDVDPTYETWTDGKKKTGTQL
jgi:dipeptidyl aminopeptidase/acylaminoacyl peptidase